MFGRDKRAGIQDFVSSLADLSLLHRYAHKTRTYSGRVVTTFFRYQMLDFQLRLTRSNRCKDTSVANKRRKMVNSLGLLLVFSQDASL